MPRRSGASTFPGRDRILPPTLMVPVLGSTKPAISRKVVVLPQPDGPSRHTSAPRSTARSMESRTVVEP